MISIILAVYNSGKFIEETIKSILNQTVKDFELIIINDGSSDNSEEIILSIKDERIIYVKQDNQGVAGAKNAGLRMAKGEFITFHDSDDISLPNRFDRMLAGFYSEKIGFTHCDMLLITENGSPFSYWQASNILPDQLYSFFLNVGTPFNNGTILFRKEALENVFYDESIKVGSDTDFVIQVANKWPNYHIPEPLYFYRRHQTNVTNKRNYEDLAKHVKKNITDKNMLNITGIDGGNVNQNLFCAKLIAGVALSNRWLMEESITLFNEAIPLIKNNSDLLFFEGMKGMVEKDYQRSVNNFSKIEKPDHLVENYLGEALLSLKRFNEAFVHFNNALKLKPDYDAPVQNLKAIGILKNFNIIDKQVNKYK